MSLPTKQVYLASRRLVKTRDIQRLSNTQRSCSACSKPFEQIFMRYTIGEMPVRMHDQHYMHPECLRERCEMSNHCSLCSHVLFKDEDPAFPEHVVNSTEADDQVEDEVEDDDKEIKLEDDDTAIKLERSDTPMTLEDDAIKLEDHDTVIKIEDSDEETMNGESQSPANTTTADKWHPDFNQLPQMATNMQDLRLGAKWYESNNAFANETIRSAWKILNERVDNYRLALGDDVVYLNTVDPKRPTYTQKFLPLYTLPMRSKQPVKSAAYAAALRVNFMVGQMQDHSKLFTAISHPLATVACNTIATALEKMDGMTLNAATFANNLETAITDEKLFKDLHRRSCNGALPRGMQSYVKDMVEETLKWFVGPLRLSKDGKRGCMECKRREYGCHCVGVARAKRAYRLNNLF